MPIPGLYKIFDHWHQTGACHIISDTHFGEDDLKAGISNRPTDDELVKMINTKCGRADTLIHLGDVGDLTYVQKLRAKYKILICGNHDKGSTIYLRDHGTCCLDKNSYATMRDAFAEATKRYPNYLLNFSETEDSWVVFYDNNLFDEVYTGALIIGEKIILSHEPIDCLPSWLYNLHGHDHAGGRTDKRHRNVCADVIGYQPINFNQWMKEGHLARVEEAHRDTIDKATRRKIKRGGKKMGEK